MQDLNAMSNVTTIEPSTETANYLPRTDAIYQKVQDALDQVRPYLQSDGGDAQGVQRAGCAELRATVRELRAVSCAGQAGGHVLAAGSGVRLRARASGALSENADGVRRISGSPQALQRADPEIEPAQFRDFRGQAG